MHSNWTPEPILKFNFNTQKDFTSGANMCACEGPRNTSPWTNFQPVISSWPSCTLSISLYTSISRLIVLNTITPTMIESMPTMMTELNIPYQWILGSLFTKNRSHLLCHWIVFYAIREVVRFHSTSSLQYTEYVYVILVVRSRSISFAG